MWVDVRACTSAHVPTCVCKVCEIVWVDALLCGCLSVCACMCVRRACVNLRFSMHVCARACSQLSEWPE